MLGRLLHFALVLTLLAGVARADVVAETTLTPAAALERVLTATSQNPDWYTAPMLAVAPPDKMNAILSSIRTQLGTLVKLTGDGAGGNYIAVFSGGTIPCSIQLDVSGKIVRIFFSAPQPTAIPLHDALARLSALKGTVSYVVLRGNAEMAASGQEAPQAIGSAFKLAVLATLQHEIATGHRKWTDVVALQPTWKSLPTGVLQTWPTGTHLTLETLASEMISISDNTAADSLIHVLGRSAIEPNALGNVPFLTTHALFALKSRSHAADRARWRSGNIATRRAQLVRLDVAPLDIADLDLNPAYLDIGWELTNRQLCALMSKVRDLPLMSISPGVADAADWKRVAYKGGADAGVINMTTWLSANDGTNYCVSATENDPTAQIDEDGFASAYRMVLRSLKRAATP